MDSLLLPIGVIGVWRWLMWLCKRIPASFYQADEKRSARRLSFTVICPLYNELPAFFEKALDSWIANQPAEVIVIIQGDAYECECIANSRPGVIVLRQGFADKRHAICRGVESARSPVCFLVDSDAIWSPDVADCMLAPFDEQTIGGVGSRQSVVARDSRPLSTWERLADMFLDTRYADEVPALSRWGQALGCLSGRTVAYRTSILRSVMEEFVNEIFAGTRCVSGDDKCLTVLTLKAGYKTVVQLNARVYSLFEDTFVGFVRQRLRWSRNTHRSDIKALSSRWIYKHRFLAFLMADKLIAPFTQLYGFCLVSYAFLSERWFLGLLVVLWWHINRALKLLPHFIEKPRSLYLLPMFVMASHLCALIRVYTLFTINNHKWLTRGVPR